MFTYILLGFCYILSVNYVVYNFIYYVGLIVILYVIILGLIAIVYNEHGLIIYIYIYLYIGIIYSIFRRISTFL